MRICELHRVERPRERMASQGPQALSDEELLAVLFRTGYAGKSALEVAAEVLRAHPEGGVARLPVKDLGRIKGVGPSRAAAVAAAVELGRRWAGPAAERELPLDTPERVWEQVQDIRARRREHFVAFYLNARSRLMHRETVSIGTLTASLVHPREVFAPAIERRAAAVIVCHNHPSGERRPSPEDLETTRRLSRAGRIIGIELLDHVLVTDSGFYSFRQNGML